MRQLVSPTAGNGCLLLIGVLLVSGCGGNHPGDRIVATGPNVLLVTIDTLRLDRVTSHGGPDGNTPHIDGVAREGVQFNKVQAPRGLTWPSLTSLLTGAYPRTHHVRRNGTMLDASFSTLPEVLQHNGYDTGGFLANMCDAPHRGLSTFFCAWWGETGRPAERPRRTWASHDQPKWDRAVTREVDSFMRKKRDRPFFAWVHYLDPHRPYDPVEGFLRDEYDGSFPPNAELLDERTLDELPLSVAEKRQLLAAYDSQVAGVDDHIGQLLRTLTEMNLADDTLVIITADHGEELGDHNFYFYHMASVYQQVLSVPWIMRWPDHLPAAHLIDADVESIDIAPTLMALLGIEAPDSVEGVSRVPLIRSEPGAHGADYTYAEWRSGIVIVGHDRWRFIWNPGGFETLGSPLTLRAKSGFFVDTCELYDLDTDPLQERNLVDLRVEVTTDLIEHACGFVTEKPFAQRAADPVPDNVKARLEALGYVQDRDSRDEAVGDIARFCADTKAILNTCLAGR